MRWIRRSDCVGCADALIPTRDERLIHLRNASERPAAHANDVFVPEMGVGNKEDRHAANSLAHPLPSTIISQLTGKQ